MAKESFTRYKPHVNFAAVKYLRQTGLSAVGTQQLLDGQIVSSRQDRSLLAAMVEAEPAGSGLPTGKWQHKPVPITNPFESSGRSMEISFIGATQLAQGAVVTGLNDRMLLAEIIEQAATGQATGKRTHGPIRFRSYS